MNVQTTVVGRRRVFRGLLIALIVAVLLLFSVVLPAEYGYDPTHVGRLLGLTELSRSRGGQEQTLDAFIEDVISGNDNLTAAADAEPMQPLPLPNPAVSQLEAAPPRSQTMRIRLGFDERTEVKALMHKAQVILYSWKVEGGEVYVDFHGHDPSRGDHYWVRYEEAGQEQGVTGRSGSLVAPFDGEHGWFWLNVSQQPITIELTVSGYYDKLIDYGLLQ